MTVVCILADPPRPGVVFETLAETSPLSESETAELYDAILRDMLIAVDRSGGDLLVNYRPDDALPEKHVDTNESAATTVGTVVSETLDDPSVARVEVQVGSTFAGRVGNTVTHLLRDEDAQSVAVVEPTTPFLLRSTIDTAAMQLRSNEVVLGPSAGGRVYYAGFTEAIDFTDAFETPAIETLTDRASAASCDVAFLDSQPTIKHDSDLATVIANIRARWHAERVVPKHTAEFIIDTGLYATSEDGLPRIVRD
jgi:Uncharacterized protein conserved in bacteria (DUF2064).